MKRFTKTMGFTKVVGLFIALLLFALLIVPHNSVAVSSEPPQPPAQPESGPGGRQYAHAEVKKNRFGTGGQEHWLFEPDSPKPKSAPLVVFMHGWGGVNPMYYGAWIDHLVRRGNIVVYPRYQNGLLTPVKEFTPNTMHALKDAIQRLQKQPGHVRLDLKRVAVVGHSMGGLLAANLAALASESGLPRVKALMSVEPGITAPPVNFPLADLQKIHKETLLLAVVGDQDGLVGDKDARKIYVESRNVPEANKNFITLVTDDRGAPPLRASHRAPTAPDESYDSNENTERIRELMSQRSGRRPAELPATNALDFYGTWKLFDGLCDAAFYGKNREYALGNTPQQRFMGKWSDGVAVKELKVSMIDE